MNNRQFSCSRTLNIFGSLKKLTLLVKKYLIFAEGPMGSVSIKTKKF